MSFNFGGFWSMMLQWIAGLEIALACGFPGFCLASIPSLTTELLGAAVCFYWLKPTFRRCKLGYLPRMATSGTALMTLRLRSPTFRQVWLKSQWPSVWMDRRIHVLLSTFERVIWGLSCVQFFFLELVCNVLHWFWWYEIWLYLNCNFYSMINWFGYFKTISPWSFRGWRLLVSWRDIFHNTGLSAPGPYMHQ